MTSPGSDRARVERRRREHERQAVVFGVLIAFLAVGGIFALTVYSGAVTSPFDKPFTTTGTEDQKIYPVPCLPTVKGQVAGALPIAPTDIKVRLINASDETGLARVHKRELSDRGFVILETGDSPVDFKESEIRFGRKGVVQAYTFAEQFPEIRLVLDARTGNAIDLLIGSEFEPVLDVEEVDVAPDQPLQNVEGCVPADSIDTQERIKAVKDE